MKNGEKAKGTVVTDPEVVAMHRIVKSLQPLGDRARRRVLTYVTDLLAEQTEKAPLENVR